MNNNKNLFIILISIVPILNLQADQNTEIDFPRMQDSPFYVPSTDDPKFHGIKPILFSPSEDFVTGDDSNKNLLGYFWDIKDSNDSLLYQGKARIGNSQYINVVAVDSKKVNTNGDPNSVTGNNENIYKPSPEEQSQFNPGFLVYLGNFSKPNNPTIYYLYGQYDYTVLPDPNIVEVT